jgi:hypothetical protein
MLGQQRRKGFSGPAREALSPGSFLVFTEKKNLGGRRQKGISGGEGGNLGFN